eukprot:TRINITY_DN3264_c0_g5_i3.p1 TRINITY_DN3264_c0_g5~~TRINITY_DN3264_c0_g5_i3.p1  ORF type:complete len:465 (+),score=49.65 TRINITY_DN3264_c0_g5_i3:96-1490(+)
MCIRDRQTCPNKQKNSKKICPVLNEIAKDVPRTFPQLRFFKSNDNQKILTTILIATANTFPEIGYVQGFNGIAGLFLVSKFSDQETYWAIVYLLKQLDLKSLFQTGFPLLRVFNFQLETLCRYYCPSICAHLDSSEISLSFITTKWILTLFTYVLPPETALRVLTLLLLNGKKTIILAGLAMTSIIEDECRKNPSLDALEQLTQISENYPSALSPPEFYSRMSSFQVSNRLLDELESIQPNHDPRNLRLTIAGLDNYDCSTQDGTTLFSLGHYDRCHGSSHEVNEIDPMQGGAPPSAPITPSKGRINKGVNFTPHANSKSNSRTTENRVSVSSVSTGKENNNNSASNDRCRARDLRDSMDTPSRVYPSDLQGGKIFIKFIPERPQSLVGEDLSAASSASKTTKSSNLKDCDSFSAAALRRGELVQSCKTHNHNHTGSKSEKGSFCLVLQISSLQTQRPTHQANQ